MVLGQYEEMAFRALSKLFFYLTPFPVKWDYKRSQLQVNKPKVKWIPYGLHILYIWAGGWSCLLLLYLHGYVRHGAQVTIINLLTLAMSWVFLCVFCLGVFMAYQNMYAIISVVNEVLAIADEITKEFPEDGGKVSGDGGKVSGDGGNVSGDGGNVSGDGGKVSGDGRKVSADGGKVSKDGRKVFGDGGKISADGGKISADGGKVSGDGGKVPADAGKVSKEDSVSMVSILLPFGLVPAALVFPFFSTAIAIFLQTDAGYLLGQEILWDPRYRDMSTIYLFMLFRCVAFYSVNSEICRSACFAACCLFIVIDRAGSIMLILLTRVKNTDRFCYYYIRGVLLLRKVERIAHVAIYIMMSTAFWALIITCYVVVKGSPETIGYAMYIGFLGFFLFVVAVHAIGLPMVCSDLEMAVYVVTYHCLLGELLYAKRKTRLYRRMLKRVKAIAPVKIMYGQFWVIGEDFLVEYTEIILNRCFDAILTF